MARFTLQSPKDGTECRQRKRRMAGSERDQRRKREGQRGWWGASVRSRPRKKDVSRLPIDVLLSGGPDPPQKQPDEKQIQGTLGLKSQQRSTDRWMERISKWTVRAESQGRLELHLELLKSETKT